MSALGKTIVPAAVLAAVLLGGVGVQDVAGEPGMLKGTVTRVKPGLLYVKCAAPEGEEAGSRDLMILVNKSTVYFDGPRQATKEDVVPGLIVLVKHEPVGTGRRALLIRIIGGKTP